MALIHNAALPFKHKLCSPEKDDEDSSGRQVGFLGGSRMMMMIRCLKLNASIKTNIETVNGKKVNGVHVDEIPFLEQRNTNLLKDGRNLMNDEYLIGRFVEERFVFRQAFVVRSYEIGPDKTVTMETLMNLLQVALIVFIFYFLSGFQFDISFLVKR